LNVFAGWLQELRRFKLMTYEEQVKNLEKFTPEKTLGEMKTSSIRRPYMRRRIRHTM
jgi:hypothetical protein